MTTKPTQTKENTLYLPIKQVYFDAILNGTKDKEYRTISPNTLHKYIENRKVDGELQLLYYPDLISEERLRLYFNDEMCVNIKYSWRKKNFQGRRYLVARGHAR